jgi:hypothetical protein
MVSVHDVDMLVAAFIALIFFAVWSFWIPRIARRIQIALETRHPDLLKQITPADTAHWMEHWRFQGSVAVAWAFLPIASGLDDEALEDDVVRFKVVWALAVVTLVIMAVCFYLAVS